MILSLLVLGAFILYVYLAVLVLTMRKPRTLSHWLLFGSALCAAYWAFFSYFAYNAETIVEVKHWFYVSVLGMFGYFPMNLLFVISVVPKRTVTLAVALGVTLPAVALFILNFFYPVVFSDFFRGEMGWIFVPSIGTFLNFCWQIYAVGCFSAGILFMSIWRYRTKLNREKKQIRLLVSTQVAAILAVFLEFRLHDLLVKVRPATISPVLISIWIIGMVMAVKRYHFLSISPETVSREILASIDEVIILINEHEKVTYMNEKALTLFELPYRKIAQRDIKDFLAVSGRERKLLSFIPGSGTSCKPEKSPLLRGAGVLVQEGKDEVTGVTFTVVIKGPANRMIDARITPVEDRYGDLLGYLLIGSEEKESIFIDEGWGLNDREREICKTLVRGFSNNGIAAELGLKEQTIKNNLASIYRKTSVSNRYELVRKLIDGK